MGRRREGRRKETKEDKNIRKGFKKKEGKHNVGHKEKRKEENEEGRHNEVHKERRNKVYKEG